MAVVQMRACRSTMTARPIVRLIHIKGRTEGESSRCLMQINRNTSGGAMMSSSLTVRECHAGTESCALSIGDIMVQAEPRIILAAVAVFAALAGLGATIRGLLFDSPAFIHYGALALVAGVASFVVLLIPTTGGDT